MKKKFLSGFILLIFLINCNEKKKETTENPASKVNLFKDLYATPQDSVILMAEHYKTFIEKFQDSGIQQVNMDGPVLKGIASTAEGIKLIYAADLKTNERIVFMQIWQNSEFTYYNIAQFFNSGQRGMRNQPILCPPPNGCDLPTSQTVVTNTIPQDKVQEMAKLYNEKVKSDVGIAVRQITTDAKALDALLTGVLGFKLIAAYDTAKNDVTIILQLWKGDLKFFYYDINQYFNSSQPGMRGQPPLCPPPAGCDSEILVPTQKK